VSAWHLRPPGQRRPSRAAAAGAFGADGAFDLELSRAALGRFGSPVLLLAGELHPGTPPLVAAQYAAIFPNCELAVLPSVSHYPWLDDPNEFSALVSTFLSK
jgi:proline iminopeptidase